VALAISAAALVVGALLVWRADQGIDELQAVFVWLGILLLVLGVAIVGWGLMLRSREQEEGAE
jgi:drug/metabolite transporter (DMT)-like permease